MKKEFLVGCWVGLYFLLAPVLLQGQCLDYSDSMLVLERGVPNKISVLNWLQPERGTAELTRAHLSQSLFDPSDRRWTFLRSYVMDHSTGEWTITPDEYMKGCRQSVFRRDYHQVGSYWTCTDTISICIEEQDDPRFDSISNGVLSVGCGANSSLFTDFDRDLFLLDGWEHSLFSAPGHTSLWIGGKDSSGEVHFSGESPWHSGRLIHSSWPGPARMNPLVPMDHFEKVWKLDKRGLKDSLSHGDYPTSYNNAGNASKPWASFVDVDSDGVFTQYMDYPCLLGDEMLFTTYHFAQNPEIRYDEREFPVDVHQYLFVSEQPELAPVAFMRLEVVNTSFEAFDSVYIGMFSEMWTLMQIYDDYMGCDTSLQLFYNYSKDEVIGVPFTDSVRQYRPASGVVFLNHNLDQFIPFFKSAGGGCSGFTRGGDEAFMYLQGRNRRGMPYYEVQLMCRGAKRGRKVRRLYTGNPLDTTSGWSMRRSKPETGARYAIGSSGPWTLQAHDTFVLDLAFIVGHKKGSTYLNNLSLLFERTKAVREWYAANGFVCYDRKLLGNEEVQQPSFTLYPNPSNGWVKVLAEVSGTLELKDFTGKTLQYYPIKAGEYQVLTTQELAQGAYWAVLHTSEGRQATKLFVARP